MSVRLILALVAALAVLMFVAGDAAPAPARADTCLRDGSCYPDSPPPVATPAPRPTQTPPTPGAIFMDRYGVCWQVGGTAPVPCP